MSRRALMRPAARTILLLGSVLAAGPIDNAAADGVVPADAAACSPSTSILKSPRAGSKEVQAKALNDRGDIVANVDSGGGPQVYLWRLARSGSSAAR